jgi:hypothetical protein
MTVRARDDFGAHGQSITIRVGPIDDHGEQQVGLSVVDTLAQNCGREE